MLRARSYFRTLNSGHLSAIKQRYSDYLEREYLKWRQDQHDLKKAQSEFADYLGISHSLLSHYLNGRSLPSLDNLPSLASRLGFEVYEVLGMQKPIPDLEFISHHWEDLSPEQQKLLVEEVKLFLNEEESEVMETT